jgi:hypothetical protein
MYRSPQPQSVFALNDSMVLGGKATDVMTAPHGYRNWAGNRTGYGVYEYPYHIKYHVLP